MYFGQVLTGILVFILASMLAFWSFKRAQAIVFTVVLTINGCWRSVYKTADDAVATRVREALERAITAQRKRT